MKISFNHPPRDRRLAVIARERIVCEYEHLMRYEELKLNPDMSLATIHQDVELVRLSNHLNALRLERIQLLGVNHVHS